MFVVLTQHLIQSTMRCENSTLLCIKWFLAPPRWKATVDLSNVPSILWVELFTSQSEEAALLIFLDLSNYKGDAQPIHNSSN